MRNGSARASNAGEVASIAAVRRRRARCASPMAARTRPISLLVAAGAWSHRLAAQLGDTIPLETERGYNTTLPVGAFDLKRQLIFGGHGFVITPLSTGLRVGGAVELGGLDLPPNYARSKAMLEKAKRFLPGLQTRGRARMDGLSARRCPIRCRSSAVARNARTSFYAFGHGHLGLTQAAGTGALDTRPRLGQTCRRSISRPSARSASEDSSMARHTFSCIDGHTCGNPVRLVAGGGPLLKGATMMERRAHFLAEYDWIRTGLMFEPRGHDMMSGSILYPPTRDGLRHRASCSSRPPAACRCAATARSAR